MNVKMEKQMMQSNQALRAPGATAVDVQPKATGRLLFVDNIRVLLTILVLLFHLMIIYAGTGSWQYTEGREDSITSVVGAWFVAVNQAYFMGLFLLVSAYFVPGSYDRKGAGRFLKDRLIRLGIPLAVYSWIIDPLFGYGRYALSGGPRLPVWEAYAHQFRYGTLLGPGPLWFVETLLIFSALYVAWRLLAQLRPPRPASVAQAAQPAVETRFPGNGLIALLALLLGVAGFLVRLWLPIGYSFVPLNLQFPFFAQYIVLFCLGLIAYRRNWFQSLPEATGRLWLRVAIVLILLFPPLALAGGSPEPFAGGWHWQAFAYALWESFLCLAMCIGLIYLFRRQLNHQGPLARFLSPNAYTAYLIHGPIITTIALAARDVMLYPLLKWGLVALVAVPLCFGLSHLIRKLPYTDRVL
jgi:glucan biosynthesis protein C